MFTQWQRSGTGYCPNWGLTPRDVNTGRQHTFGTTEPIYGPTIWTRDGINLAHHSRQSSTEGQTLEYSCSIRYERSTQVLLHILVTRTVLRRTSAVRPHHKGDLAIDELLKTKHCESPKQY